MDLKKLPVYYQDLDTKPVELPSDVKEGGVAENTGIRKVFYKAISKIILYGLN